MVSKSETTIHRHSARTKTLYLTIPAEIASDSQFPFRWGEKLIIEIRDDELIIYRKEQGGEG